MIGLILKDLYQSKTNILITILAFIIITTFCIILQMAPVAPFIMTTLLTSTIAHTIVTDKKTKWELIEKTMPIEKEEIIKSKYILYIIVLAVGCIISLMYIKMLTYTIFVDFSSVMSITIISNLIFGSILLPCNFILDVDKSYLSMMISIIFTIFILLTINLVYTHEYFIIIGIFSFIAYITSYKILLKIKRNTN